MSPPTHIECNGNMMGTRTHSTMVHDRYKHPRPTPSPHMHVHTQRDSNVTMHPPPLRLCPHTHAHTTTQHNSTTMGTHTPASAYAPMPPCLHGTMVYNRYKHPALACMPAPSVVAM